MFSGDLTEDPEHPKIFWPSEENCPKCYSWKNERSLDVDAGLALLIKGMIYNLFIFFIFYYYPDS